MSRTNMLWVGILTGVMMVPAAALAIPPFVDAATYNYKDMLADNLGNGRGDRDGGAPSPGFVGDGIPDVMQAWMVMYDIQVLGNTTARDAFNANHAYIAGNMTPFAVFVDEGHYYCTVNAGGRAYWTTFATASGFNIPTAGMSNGVFGRYAAMDDPDGDGVDNGDEFNNTVMQYGLPTDIASWTSTEWDVAYELNHGLGTGIPPVYTENDVMTTFAAVALDPNRVPEPATLGLLGLAGLGLLSRRRW